MTAPDDRESSFEAALEELEQIVGDLERGNPELSEALKKYERGVRLLAQCHRQLDSAEQAVALLTGVDESGNPQTAPFDATATAERESPTPAKKRASSRAASTLADRDIEPPF